MKTFVYLLLSVFVLVQLSVLGPGCAQIGAPTGGAKDTLAPRLVSASPALKSVNFNGNRISLTFDEYVEVKEAQQNVLVSPYPKTAPVVDYKLKTVTVKLKDTLKPNTTYSINFGNAIVDVHEGNPYTNFTYVFSTGPVIDSMELTGKVLLAETGKADSSLVAMLYRDGDDSLVQKRRPDYIANLKGDGSFRFVNLPAGVFKVYALKDGDGGKTYNSKSELFAFSDLPVTISSNTSPAQLYAYAVEKDNRGTTPSTPAKNTDKKLRYTSDAQGGTQDLLNNLVLSFNKPLRNIDTSKIVLTDTNNVRISSKLTVNSTRKELTLQAAWVEDKDYRLFIDSSAVADSIGTKLVKNDTLRFRSKKESDYGSILLRFSKLDLSRKPVLLFLVNDEIKYSYPLTASEWSKKLFTPGEYQLSILYDNNGNGKWDPGDYGRKRQPELVVPVTQKLSIRANWENEREIKL